MSIAAKARCTPKWREAHSMRLRTAVDESAVASLYMSGKSQIEVAQELGIGRKVVANVMKRCGIQARKAVKRNQWGETNSSWRGDKASLCKLHRRLDRRFGKPKRCEVCGTTDDARTYDWANLSGRYTDMSDFKRMCRSCHWKYDNKILNLGRGANGHTP